MANYPPPGQAHPDQPSDPWQEAPLWGSQPPSPYGDPSGYIGEQYSPAAPPGYPPPGSVPQQWGPPQPPKQGLSTVAIALITAAIVVVLGGGVLGVYALSSDGKKNTPLTQGSSGSPAAHSSGSPAASTQPSSAPPSERDFRTAKNGDCLVNNGTNDAPVLQFSTCKAGAYKVVGRFDNTDDRSRCQAIADSDLAYFYRKGTDKFVLCFQKL